MIKVSVLYPTQPDGHFDMDYYVNKHVPLVLGRCGEYVKPAGIERGLSGGAPGVDAPYHAAGHLIFESVDAMNSAMGPHMQEIFEDLANFTNIQPVVQISEVVLPAGQRPGAMV